MEKGHCSEWKWCTTMKWMLNSPSHTIPPLIIPSCFYCMIKSSRVSTVNGGFWQEIKETSSRKQQGRKAAKLPQTTGLEAEGIFIHPANIDFFLCCSLHQCFKHTPHPTSPVTTTSSAPLRHRACSVLGGFIKVAHQSHDVVHSLLTTISGDVCVLLCHFITQNVFSIKV